MEITNQIIEKHGLKLDEYKTIQKLLKREPNSLELEFSQLCGTSIVLTNLLEYI